MTRERYKKSVSLVLCVVCILACLLGGNAAVQAQGPCPGNPLANAGFEDGARQTQGEGTSLSSSLARGWYPWSILGNQSYNREVEYKVVDMYATHSPYRVHSGRSSQQFFTTYATHTAGFYQRVPVIPGSLVTFSIWVQVYTGEREVESRGIPISDPEAPGNYRVSVGIDPTGATPPGFGAPPSEVTVWSTPVLGKDLQREYANSDKYDAWERLVVSARARADFVTVYTKGQPEYRVKHNNSFWDDACLRVVPPPTPTPSPTFTPSPTATPTDTLLPTDTPSPTATLTGTPTATSTLTSTSTPKPSGTATPSPLAAATMTASPLPSSTLTSSSTIPLPALQPTASPTAPAATPTTAGVGTDMVGARLGDSYLLLFVGVVALLSLVTALASPRRK